MAPHLFSGFGIRTMSTLDAAFNPLGYHLGTVWPHDTAIAAAGLARYGFRDAAAAIAAALVHAADDAFDGRLPEVFAGYPAAAHAAAGRVPDVGGAAGVVGGRADAAAARPARARSARRRRAGRCSRPVSGGWACGACAGSRDARA